MEEKRTDILESKLLFYIKESLIDLYEHDNYLIWINRPKHRDRNRHQEDHVGERAIVFRFGHYLQNRLDLDHDFRGYNLDCEYNRNGLRQKEVYGRATYPDMILHRRGSNNHNIMVIEFKGYWNNNREYDEKKIRGFTNDNGEYKYSVGYTVLIGRRLDKVVIEEYKKGEFQREISIKGLDRIPTIFM